MLSLSPTLAKRCADALETVARVPLAPIVNRETPRHLTALPPSIRGLPPTLQVQTLCDMLADAHKEIDRAWRKALQTRLESNQWEQANFAAQDTIFQLRQEIKYWVDKSAERLANNDSLRAHIAMLETQRISR